MRSSNDGESFADLIVLSSDDLRGGQVNQLHIALLINHEIFRLDIPTDNLVVIEVLQNQDDRSPIELTIFC